MNTWAPAWEGAVPIRDKSILVLGLEVNSSSNMSPCFSLGVPYMEYTLLVTATDKTLIAWSLFYTLCNDKWTVIFQIWEQKIYLSGAED